MPHTIPGLHHVTAISGPPQQNVDFYVGVMGQYLVKKTVNFDAPDTYHLYHGNRAAEPGSILTFFPFVNAGPGRAGPGMASAVAYAVPRGELEPWMMMLAEAALDFDNPSERFGEPMIALGDPDGLRLELIETDTVLQALDGSDQPADDGFHSVTLWLDDPAPTARLLTDIFGYESGPETSAGGETRQRLIAPGKGRASVIDLLRSDAKSIGRQGAGSVHHVAFRAETDDIQAEWRERLVDAGFQVTPKIDRQYFNAIYFREPGGVLFEIATDPPGFATDEPADALGRNLMLPHRHEPMRKKLESTLPQIRLPKSRVAA